jgi:hypothetical protein
MCFHYGGKETNKRNQHKLYTKIILENMIEDAVFYLRVNVMSSSWRSSAYILIQVAALQDNDVTKFTLLMRKEERREK